MDYLNAVTCTDVPIYNFATACTSNVSCIMLNVTMQMCRYSANWLCHCPAPTVCVFYCSDNTITNVSACFTDQCAMFVETGTTGRTCWGCIYNDTYLNPNYINCTQAKCLVYFGFTDLYVQFRRNNICYKCVIACSPLFSLAKCAIGKWTQGQARCYNTTVTLKIGD